MSAIKPRTAIVDIYQGDYLARLRDLEQRHKAALIAEKSGTTLRNDEIPESQTIADEHAAVKLEAEEGKVAVTLGALGRKGWRALVAAHPPRPDNDDDAGMGVNEEAFKDALVPLSVLSIEPASVTVDDLDDISDIDWDRLYYSAFALNRAPAAAPKALTPPASQEKPTSDET